MSIRLDLFRDALVQIENAIAQIRSELDEQESRSKTNCNDPKPRPHEKPPDNLPVDSSPSRSLASYQLTAKTPLSRPEQAILAATAWLEKAQPLKMHRTLIASLAGFTPSEKSFYGALDNLSSRELITLTPETAKLTEKGAKIAIKEATPLTSDILAERVAMQLTRQQSAIFGFLFKKRGSGATRNEIARECNLDDRDKRFQRELFTLQRLSLIYRSSSDSYSCAEMLFID